MIWNTNPMLLIDFYKAVHAEMLPEKITKSVSYFTPRMSRVDRWDKVVMKEKGLIVVCEPFFVDDELREKVTKWVEWANSVDQKEYDPFAE